MEDYKKILRKVGIILILVGLIDIGVMVYCITNNISYSSSLNIFAVIAGIYLFRGSVKAAHYVSWFSLFMLAGMVGMIPFILFVQPLGLIYVNIKLNPLVTLLLIALMPVILGFIYWVQKELYKPEVIRAKSDIGIKGGRPKLPIILGAAIPILLGAILIYANYGESGQAIKDKARETYGDQFSYHIQGMNWSGSDVSAQIAAYDSDQVLYLSVECRKSSKNVSVPECVVRSPY